MVRQPLRHLDVPSRTLQERLMFRMPGLSAAAVRLIVRLPPRSRLRRTFLARSVETGMAAYNRRDLDAVLLAFHPEVEYRPYRDFVEAGLAEPCYRGHDGYRAYIQDTYEVWGTDVQLEPTEVVDLGDRLVVLANMPMRAQASGVALAQKYASIWTLGPRGIVRAEDYLDQAEALRAAGVPD